MVCVEAEVRQDCAVGALGDLQSDAVTLAKPALLPRSEDVEEAAHANDYAYGHCAPCSVVGGASLHSHGFTLVNWTLQRPKKKQISMEYKYIIPVSGVVGQKSKATRIKLNQEIPPDAIMGSTNPRKKALPFIYHISVP
jgi:hypothetical protein